jgi:hypothetical protein
MNKKLEQRWFKTGDGKCPLCGEPDSCTHIVSGCSKLTGLYTERHNKIARIMLKAILKGSMGAEVKQADIGSADKLTKSGLTLEDTHRYVPKDMLPATIANDPDAYAALSRPDATLRCSDDYGTLIILEFKVCRDTDQSYQQDKAEKQHETLVSHLRHRNHRVQQLNILVGATGTVYKNTLDQLVTLGVGRTHALKALEKVHMTLVQDLHTIVCERRRQEYSKKPSAQQTGRPPPTSKGRKR